MSTPILKYVSATSNKQNGIMFRIVFHSPFFELEVCNGGQRWQTVRSQEPVTLEGENYYALLNFTSYNDAFDYATDVLKLHNMQKTRRWWFTSPPASATGPHYHEKTVLASSKSGPVISPLLGAALPQGAGIPSPEA